MWLIFEKKLQTNKTKYINKNWLTQTYQLDKIKKTIYYLLFIQLKKINYLKKYIYNNGIEYKFIIY